LRHFPAQPGASGGLGGLLGSGGRGTLTVGTAARKGAQVLLPEGGVTDGRVLEQYDRVDLLFFHRRLRCLVIVDLKLGKFTHADAGQMHMYLNYACAHWTHPDEHPPVGLIL
jgi:hypothetical protein